MSQTAYGLLQTPLPGVISDSAWAKDVRSAANLDPTWNIPFGVFVARDTADGVGAATALLDEARMPGASTDEILGVVVMDHTHDNGPNGTLVQSGVVGTSPGPGLINSAVFGTMRKGRINVLVETDVAVVVGKPVFVRYSQNGAGKLQLGAARMDADTAHAVQVNARFVGPAKTVPATTGGPGNVGASAGAAQASQLVAEIELDMSFSGTIP
jgi:hypothetical protein